MKHAMSISVIVLWCAVSVLLTTSADASVVYTGNSGELWKFNQPALDGGGSFVNSYNGSKDLAADETGVYMTTAGTVWKFNHSGTLIAASFTSTFSTVAVGKDGYVYVSNGAEIGRFNSDLTGWTSLISAGGITDLAVNENGIYGTNGTTVFRGSLSGGWTGWISSFTSTFSSVAVGTDGYVYTTTGGEIGRFNSDLTGWTSLVTAGGVTDLAADSTGIYATSGGSVYRFNLEGGWTGANSTFNGGFDTVATIVVPEPLTMAVLCLGGITGAVVRSRKK